MDIVQVKRTVRARTEQMLGKALVEESRVSREDAAYMGAAQRGIIASIKSKYVRQAEVLQGVLDLLDMTGVDDHVMLCPSEETVLVLAAVAPFLLPPTMVRWIESEGADPDMLINCHVGASE